MATWIGHAQETTPDAESSLALGEGVFETMLAVEGNLFLWELHEARLRRSAGQLGLGLPSKGKIETAIQLELATQGLLTNQAKVRVTCCPAGVMATAMSLPAFPQSLVLTTQSFPLNAESPLAGLKSVSYLENLLALRGATAMNCDEVLRFNHRRELAEAACANVFLVLNDQLITPDLCSGGLPGITRACLLEWCAQDGIEIVVRVVHRDELAQVAGIALTSALKGVLPVNKMDALILDPEHPKIRSLQEVYRQRFERWKGV